LDLDQSCLQRWKLDNTTFPTYQYRLSAGLISRTAKEWRYANPGERERLLCYRTDFTYPCWYAKDIKANLKGHESARLNLLGGAQHAGVLAFFVGNLLVHQRLLKEPPSPSIIAVPPRSTKEAQRGAHLHRHEAPAGVRRGERWRARTAEESLVVELMRRQTYRGSGDVRSAGILGPPMRWPRNELKADWWDWKPIFSHRWEMAEHINTLELRSALGSIRWRVKVAGNIGTRALHLLDSQVVLGAITHGRSGSEQLWPVLERLNATLLGGSISLVFGYVRSEHNPADEPSRIA